jgi:glycosyltransferase involved in cell wall biosynthesis
MLSQVTSENRPNRGVVPDPQAAPASLVISVVVPALNEEKVIGACLKSLAQQNFPHGAFEVIVVDNGSTDRTVEIAKSFEESLNLRVLTAAGVRISALRNLGASAASGEFVAFLDSDCIAPPAWLAQAVEFLKADASAVIGAHYAIPRNSSWVAEAWYGEQNSLKEGAVSYLPGGDLLLSRSLFLKSGGFDESIDTNEDAEFCSRISSLGTPVMAVPSLGVIHLGTPQTLFVFYRKHRWHGNDVHRVFLRDIAHSRNRKAILFAFYILACELGLLSGLALGIGFGNYSLLAASVFLLIFGPLILAARTAAKRKRWQLLAPLTLLFLVYGMARAVSLLSVKAHRVDRAAQTNETRANLQEQPAANLD